MRTSTITRRWIRTKALAATLGMTCVGSTLADELKPIRLEPVTTTQSTTIFPSGAKSLPTIDDAPATKWASQETPASEPAAATPAAPTDPPVTATKVLSSATDDLAYTDDSSETMAGITRWRGTCPPGRLWARGEVLLWWADGMNTPPLVTTANPPGQGILGQPGTQILYGGNRINDDFRVGGRFEAGYWIDPCHNFGIQAGGFFLGQSGDSFFASGNGTQVISRPFFNANPANNAQAIQIVSGQGNPGAILIGSDTQVAGGNVGLRHNLCCSSGSVCPPTLGGGVFETRNLNCCRLDIINGFQMLYLDDEIAIQETPTVPQLNLRFILNDNFRAVNRFYGYNVGTVMSCYRGRFSFEFAPSIALGAMDREVIIYGDTTTLSNVPGVQPTMALGGLLAQRTNIGKHEDTQFAVVPQIGLNIGYAITKNLRIFGGYTFLYANNVMRAGDAIDPVVDSRLIPPPAAGANLATRPRFEFKDGDFWAQGINLGAELRF